MRHPRYGQRGTSSKVSVQATSWSNVVPSNRRPSSSFSFSFSFSFLFSFSFSFSFPFSFSGDRHPRFSHPASCDDSLLVSVVPCDQTRS